MRSAFPRHFFFGASGVLIVVLLSVAVWAWRAEAGAQRKRQNLIQRISELADRVEREKTNGDRDGRFGVGAVPSSSRILYEQFEQEMENALAERRARFFERMENDPVFQNHYMALQRAERLDLFRPFFREKNLSPEQVERLGDAWARSQVAAFDLRAAGKKHRLSHRDPAVMKLSSDANADLHAEEVAVIGEAGAAQMRQWEKTLSVRSVMSSFAGKSVLAGVSIDRDQMEALVRLCVGSPGAKTGRYSRALIDWEAVSAGAGDVLTTEQHALFAIEAERQRAQADFRQTTREVQKLQAERAMGGR
jgi:hypothetical protein